MDKNIQRAKAFVTNPKNRTTVIAVGVGVAVAGIIVAMTTKRGGKAKPKP